MDDLNFGFSEKPLELTTIQELDNLVKQCFDLRKEYEDLKDKASEKHAEYEKMQRKVQSILEATGRLNHTTPGAGTLSLKESVSVSFPKDSKNAEKFRQYLVDRGLEMYLTMNHAALNKLFKDTREELGGDTVNPESVLPGIEGTETRIIVSMRKGK